MKQCRACQTEKPIASFTARGKSRPGEYQNDCNECRKAQLRKNKQFISSLVKRWKLIKGCANCDFKAEHSCQLDIDHIIPKGSKGNDRQAINTSWSKDRLKKELSKCQVLCANCHRLKTYRDGTMFK